jgi:fatty-acyl-CoA synthase
MPEKIYQPGESYAYPLIIKKLLNTPLIYSPEREIVDADKNRYDYRTFNERIHRLAGGLSRLGVKAGNTVAVLDYDSPRYLECFFAVPMMGAVLQTVNWRLSSEQIVYTLNHAEADLIITNAGFLSILESIWKDLKTVKAVVVMVEEDQRPDSQIPVVAEYEEMLRSAPFPYPFPDLDENTKATTFYTTGTTGNPKGVFFTHRQLVLHTLSVSVMAGSLQPPGWGFRANDVYMPITPMFHVHAWGYPYISTLLGAKQVYPGQYEPEKLLRLIDKEKVTFSHCVPTILQMILNCPAIDQVDLSHWRVIIGGARFPKGLAKAAQDRGISIQAGYGMSETCPVMTAAIPKDHMLDWPEDQLRDILIKTGKVIPLAEVEVADPEDRLLPHDGQAKGEVIMRSPWLTQGYFKEPEKSQELWRNGWLHSGDVGYIDQEGYLQITDRIKDVIKSGGEWVSSLDLENALSQHPAVLESAAFGVPDPKWGERPVMVVTLKPEFADKITEEALKEFMKKFAAEGKLPKYGVPDRYILVETIPKTSVGKLDKKVIRKKYGGEMA